MDREGRLNGRASERERGRREAERREKERAAAAAKDRVKNEEDGRTGVAEVKEREGWMKRRKIVSGTAARKERGGGGPRGIRSTIHRIAVALALAWRSATPLPRGGGTDTHTHAYTLTRNVQRIHARVRARTHRVCY